MGDILHGEVHVFNSSTWRSPCWEDSEKKEWGSRVKKGRTISFIIYLVLNLNKIKYFKKKLNFSSWRSPYWEDSLPGEVHVGKTVLPGEVHVDETLVDLDHPVLKAGIDIQLPDLHLQDKLRLQLPECRRQNMSYSRWADILSEHIFWFYFSSRKYLRWKCGGHFYLNLLRLIGSNPDCWDSSPGFEFSTF